MIRNRAPPPINTLTAIRGPPLSSAAARQIMWDQYFPWVQGTYGDAAKTKTITTKKYARIVALLKSLTCGNSSLAPVLDKVPSMYYVSTFKGTAPIHLHLIFEISSLKNQVRRTGFFVYYELDFYCLCSLQKSSSK